MYLHSSSWMAQGWPDRGEAWSNSSGKTLAPNRFWQFLILLWWKYVKMMKMVMNDEALNVELPHLHTKPYWMFDLNIWGKFSFRKVVGRKRSWRLLRQLICWTFPLEAKVKMTDPLNGMVIWLQCKFYLDNRMIPNVRLHCEPHCLNYPDFHICSPSHTPSFHTSPWSKHLRSCVPAAPNSAITGFLARSLKGEAGQVSLAQGSGREWKRGVPLSWGYPVPPVIIHFKSLWLWWFPKMGIPPNHPF